MPALRDGRPTTANDRLHQEREKRERETSQMSAIHFSRRRRAHLDELRARSARHAVGNINRQRTLRKKIIRLVMRVDRKISLFSLSFDVTSSSLLSNGSKLPVPKYKSATLKRNRSILCGERIYFSLLFRFDSDSILAHSPASNISRQQRSTLLVTAFS